MRYSNRLFLYAPFAVLLIIAAAAMLRWREVADQWQTKLLAANRGEEIAPGVTLHFTSEEIGGFPFNLDIVLDKFVLAIRSTRGPISLESERFAIHALTYGRTQQVMEAAGLQILIWTDAEGGAHRFTFVPGSLRASAIERDGRLTRFTVSISDRPGGLARFAAIIADAGASVLEINHDRAFASEDITTVTVHCILETRDAEHIREVRQRLAREGFQLAEG